MWGQNVLSRLSFPFNESFVDFGGKVGGGGHIIIQRLKYRTHKMNGCYLMANSLHQSPFFLVEYFWLSVDTHFFIYLQTKAKFQNCSWKWWISWFLWVFNASIKFQLLWHRLCKNEIWSNKGKSLGLVAVMHLYFDIKINNVMLSILPFLNI